MVPASACNHIRDKHAPKADERSGELAKIIETSPEKMSLNQMFRVARLYPEGSKEFNRIIGIALAHYPDDPTANLNAAAAKVSEGDYEGAKSLLTKVPATRKRCGTFAE